MLSYCKDCGEYLGDTIYGKLYRFGKLVTKEHQCPGQDYRGRGGKMTIPKAIEILTILESRSINNSTMFKKDALKLGIEALKRLQEHRSSHIDISYCPLPSETEE